MPRENQSYKAQRSKITASQAYKLKPQKKTPRPGDKGPRYNVNRLWDTDIKGFYLQCGTGGTKTWYLRYTNEFQRQQTYQFQLVQIVKYHRVFVIVQLLPSILQPEFGQESS